ncbi:MAG: hypothetical protein EZS28_018615 [Streblomastix strix]|uniref:PCI domain-containing protein n=1 Tax=Streblomastix strix TaxID=222440 RepID=A0A5J4VTD4_9EUKA|nr:MAG: hypothetical protein EZS28_018615 [Streblomastix strix]
MSPDQNAILILQHGPRVSYDQACKLLNLSEEDMEDAVSELIESGKLNARLLQTERTIAILSTIPGDAGAGDDLTLEDWKLLSEKLKAIQQAIRGALQNSERADDL